VEDEIVVREGIRNSIQWDKTPYVLAGEAPDGEMALSLIKDIKPDILVTDIKMPFMDGLALSRIITKIQPWVKIIIISGHDEFQYAKEAISIGVNEYLLKPVSASDMLSSLDKVAAVIEKEKESLLSLENLKLQVQSNSEIIRERWLCDIVTGMAGTEDAIEKAREMQIDLIARNYLVAIVELSASGDAYPELITARILVNSILEKQNDVLCFSQGMDRQILLLKKTEMEPLEETVYTLAQGIKYEVERNTGCLVSVGIGFVVERIAALRHSYAEADRTLKYLAKTGQHLIAGVAEIQDFGEVELFHPGGDPIADRLRCVKKIDIDEIVAYYVNLIGDKPIQTTLTGYYLLGDVIVGASKVIEELGGDIHDVIPAVFQKTTLDEMLGSKEKFCAGVRFVIEAVISFRESRITGKYQVMIEKAKQYIDGNFANQDISLHSVASVVNVSPNHFSTVFTQETGENFIEYLTKVRIACAKHLLLSTSMKSADIAYEAGFGDPHYFSFIFKKITGVSPREFRTDGEPANP
jgi:two-component system response regulator YesN